MQLSILFVVHAGEGVGLGHLTRSLVAARSLVTRLGVQVNFVAVGQSIDHVRERDLGIHFSLMHGPIDVVVDRLTKNKVYPVICLDLFNPLLLEGLGSVLEKLCTAGSKIVAIDSLPGFENLIDLLFVPSFMPPAHFDICRFQGRLAYGWDAFFLNISGEDQIPETLESILVLTGGSDVTQLGREWPAILNRCLPSGSVVRWVTGPFSKSPIFPDSPRIEFIEHIAPAGLSVLMRKASVAVTVYGVSFYELMALGVPTVVFSPYDEKDSRELRCIAEQKIALVAQDAQDATEQAAILLKNHSLKATLSQNAKEKLKQVNGEYFAEEIRLILTGEKLDAFWRS